MAGVIFDTSIYVSALREGNASLFAARRTTPHGEHTKSPLWLSAVVLEELYAGASEEKAKRLCSRLEREFDLLGRILVPQRSDWTACGQVLSLIGSKHGYERIGRSRLTNDALIAVSAARLGFTVVTKNAADFQLISEFRTINWRQS
jgi:predicted nucleic acid-binding protein